MLVDTWKVGTVLATLSNAIEAGILVAKGHREVQRPCEDLISYLLASSGRSIGESARADCKQACSVCAFG